MSDLRYHRGWRSTKLHLSLITLAVMTFAYSRTGWNEHAFDGFVVGILGVLGFYSGASTYEKVKSPAATHKEP